MTAVIRAPQPQDRADWGRLWRGYLNFYSTVLDPSVTDGTWARITNGDAAVGGLVAEGDNGLVGLLHYVVHPTTWTTTPACYLEDLFVAPEARGAGVGRALITALTDMGRTQGWSSIHWITGHDNAAGMRLYDRVARRTTWVRYEIDLA